MTYPVFERSRRIIVILANYTVGLAVWIALLFSFRESISPLWAFGLILAPVINFFIRKYAKSFFALFILHVLVVVLGCIISPEHSPYRFLNTLLLAFLAVGSIAVRLKTKDYPDVMVNPVVAGLLFLGSILTINYVEWGDWRVVGACALVYGILFIPTMFIDRFIWHDEMNRKTVANPPTMAMFKTALPMIGIMSVLVAIAGLLLLDGGLISRIVKFLGNAFTRFMIWLFSHIHSKPTVEEMPEEELAPAPIEPGSGFMELPEGEPSPLLELLQTIMVYVVVTAVSIAIVALIVYVIVKIVRSFSGLKLKKSVILSGDYEEVREQIVSTDNGRKSKDKESFLSYNQRIRRLYTKLANKRKDILTEPGTVTAREFAALFSEDERDAAFSFARIYEKARYSETSCVAADYLMARKNVSTLI